MNIDTPMTEIMDKLNNEASMIVCVDEDALTVKYYENDRRCRHLVASFDSYTAMKQHLIDRYRELHSNY